MNSFVIKQIQLKTLAGKDGGEVLLRLAVGDLCGALKGCTRRQVPMEPMECDFMNRDTSLKEMAEGTGVEPA
jgi:hypothetical protein